MRIRLWNLDLQTGTNFCSASVPRTTEHVTEHESIPAIETPLAKLHNPLLSPWRAATQLASIMRAAMVRPDHRQAPKGAGVGSHAFDTGRPRDQPPTTFATGRRKPVRGGTRTQPIGAEHS